ncbi:MAG: NADH:ubiquinone reductase (Na(+)-transporting) subunit B [Chitinophagales bacterium]
MGGIRNFLDKIKPAFSKNKYLHTTFDAIETFLFVPNEVTKRGVHIRDGMDLKRTMVFVVIAMQLCLLHGTFNIGHQHYTMLGMYQGAFEGLGPKFVYGLLQLLPIIIVVHLVGLGIEFIFAAKNGHAVEEGFLVTGMLIPLIMPPAIPLWIVAVATAFSVIIAKEAFGGTGMNILNVALTARVFIFFAYPTTISGEACWVSYDYNFLHHFVGLDNISEGFLAAHGTSLKALVNAKGMFDPNLSPIVDGWSGATPLGLAAAGGWDNVTNFSYQVNVDGAWETIRPYSANNMLWGLIPGSIGEVNKPFAIAGALMLIATGIASWRIMVSMVLGLIAMGSILTHFSGQFPTNEFLAIPWWNHMLMGSFFFAMAFMATDPVTAAGTKTGKWIYGFSIGFLGLLIRVLNPAYPEGWMLAILFLNVFSPTIDHFILQSNIKRRLVRG